MPDDTPPRGRLPQGARRANTPQSGGRGRPPQGRAQPPSPGQHGWKVTPAPDGRGSRPPSRPPGPQGRWWWLAVLIVVLLIANVWISSRVLRPNAPVRIPYSPTFIAQLKHKNVKSINSTNESITGTFRKAITYPSSGPSARTSQNFTTQVPSFADQAKLNRLLNADNAVQNAQRPSTGPSTLTDIIVSFGPTLLILLIIFFIFRRAAAGGAGAGGLMSFGRSRARRVEPTDQHVTFEDVAGIEEAKQELHEIVDFLKTPDKYLKLGARIPRGVLLSGQPGTGKTLLARAVAGEAGVPFFQMSASEFVEMIVGVGASPVRDLFRQAKEDARAVSFIGATTRPEVLDQALLRPGRFDRRVVVSPPDRAGREAILKVHTRSVPLGDDVDLGGIAASTPGMVGADLANLANEAALLAARRSHGEVVEQDFTDAMERIVLGAERKVMISDEDKRRTAYHESGHAIVAMLTPGADPVRKVSIIPRGQALGVTFSAPDADRFNFDERHLIAQIKVALGGRVAEEIVFGDITTGAESDIQQLTRIARGMVGRWGMSPAIGPVAVLPADGQSPLLPGVSETSERTQQLIDEEVRRIVETAHREVTEELSAHRENLDSLVAALMAHETLDQLAAYEAAGLPLNREAQPEPEVTVPAEPVLDPRDGPEPIA